VTDFPTFVDLLNARYSDEFKYSTVSKMMHPQNKSVRAVARETGLSEATLYRWIKHAKEKGMVIPAGELQPGCRGNCYDERSRTS
jgi:transposase-like protein